MHTITRLFIGICFCAAVCWGVTNDAPSEVEPLARPATLAQQIVDKLKTAPDLLRIDDLPRAEAEPEIQANFETVVVAPAEGVRDGFTHVVIVDPATRRFWVIRSGGFAGVHEVRGPAIFTKNGDIEISQ